MYHLPLEGAFVVSVLSVNAPESRQCTPAPVGPRADAAHEVG